MRKFCEAAETMLGPEVKAQFRIRAYIDVVLGAPCCYCKPAASLGRAFESDSVEPEEGEAAAFCPSMQEEELARVTGLPERTAVHLGW